MFEKNIFKKIVGNWKRDKDDEEKQRLLDPNVNPWMQQSYQEFDNPVYIFNEVWGKNDEEKKQTAEK